MSGGKDGIVKLWGPGCKPLKSIDLNKIIEGSVIKSINWHGGKILLGTRDGMIMEVDETFDFVKKANADATNPIVVKWEQMLWKYQQALPFAKEGEKWILMDQIFKLK